MSGSKKKAACENALRIIGGDWRGRKVKFASADGLRPTLDRVRETLFNWLQGNIYQANCLDLFSGSGALAFEALSRGARHVDIVDNNPQSIRLIKENLQLLPCDKAQVYLQSAQEFIGQKSDASHDNNNSVYDIIFLDPPFNQSLLLPICDQLNQTALINESTLIYIETEASLSLSELPDTWQVYRSKQTKTLSYYLLTISGETNV